MIDDRAIRKHEAGAVLVNTARGGLVDYDALHRALASGRLRGAGLDVFEAEPANRGAPAVSIAQRRGHAARRVVHVRDAAQGPLHFFGELPAASRGEALLHRVVWKRRRPNPIDTPCCLVLQGSHTHHTLSLALSEIRPGGFHDDCFACFLRCSARLHNSFPDVEQRARSGARSHALRHRAGQLGRDSSRRHRDGHASGHHSDARNRLGRDAANLRCPRSRLVRTRSRSSFRDSRRMRTRD